MEDGKTTQVADEGNGAREAVIAQLYDICEEETPDREEVEREADFLLADLRTRGFKIVPLDPADEPVK